MRVSVLLFSVMALCSMGANALSVPEENYTLDVNLRNVPDSVQFTLSSEDNVYRQKAFTENGRLHFALNMTEDYPVELTLTGRNPKDKNDRFIIGFFGGKGVNHILNSLSEGFRADSIEFAGTPWDAAQMQYEQITRDYIRVSETVGKRLMQLRMKQSPTSEEKVAADSLSKVLMKAQNAHSARCVEWAKANPESPQVVNWLGWGYTYMDKDELRQLYSEVPENLKRSPYGRRLGKIIDITPIKEGDNLADYNIVAENVDGETVDLSKLTTPYILVEFSSLGCGACRNAAKRELPEVVKKYADILTFVSYGVEDTFKRVKRMHEIDDATWPTVWNSDADQRDDTVLKYGVTGYPTFFLFGPDRKLIHTSSGWAPGTIQVRLKQFPAFRSK